MVERGMTENGSGSLPFDPPEQENIRLREEDARLRRLLAVHSIPIPQPGPENPPPTRTVETAPPVGKEERARKRIALFRSLFRGREDVYARRWEKDDGQSGYVPAAVKDWKAINKSRPEHRKKVDQKTRKFLPFESHPHRQPEIDVKNRQRRRQSANVLQATSQTSGIRNRSAALR